jgi:hypothetical protein
MTKDEAQAKSLVARDRDWHLREAARLTRLLDVWDDPAPVPTANHDDARISPVNMSSALGRVIVRPSVRSMMLALLDEQDRDWSAGEVLDEWEHRGQPIRGADPSNATRAAISESNKAGQIYRTSPGRYKATKWRTDPPAAPDIDQGAMVALARGNGHAWSSDGVDTS